MGKFSRVANEYNLESASCEEDKIVGDERKECVRLMASTTHCVTDVDVRRCCSVFHWQWRNDDSQEYISV